MQNTYDLAFDAFYLERFMHESIGYVDAPDRRSSVYTDDMGWADKDSFRDFPVKDICARGLALLLSNKFTDMRSTYYNVRAIHLLYYSSYVCRCER